MKTSGNIYALAELASTQWGMFTSSQALAENVSRVQLSRMSSDGRIEQVARGTYKFTYAGDSPFVEVKAAWLSLSPSMTAYERLSTNPYDYVATARTAAVLLGDTELHSFPYCFAAGKGKRTARSDVKLCPWSIERQDTVIAYGLPAASAERTVSDLIRLREDPSLVGNFIEGMANRGHLFDLNRLASLLAPLALRNGYAKNDGMSFAEELIAAYAMKQMAKQADIKKRQIELLTQLIAKNKGRFDDGQL